MYHCKRGEYQEPIINPWPGKWEHPPMVTDKVEDLLSTNPKMAKASRPWGEVFQGVSSC